MAASPRSFIIGTWRSVAATSHTFLAVPAGMTVIVKDILLRNGTETAGDTMVYAYPPDFSVQAMIVRHIWQAAERDFHETRWSVVEEGGIIGAYAEKASVDFWISGTLLQGVAQLPATLRPLFADKPGEPNYSPLSDTTPLPNVSGA